MKINKFIFQVANCVALCLFFQEIKAQQPAQYTIYMYNPYGIHPAYAGAEKSLVATGVVRQQWTGFADAPQTQQINAHLPLNRINSGFGINLANDRLGAEQTLSVGLTYAYKVKMSKKGVLALAIHGGVLQKSLLGAALRTPEGDYLNGNISHKDNLLNENTAAGTTPLLDASVFCQISNVKIGLTAKNLTQSPINYTIKNTKIRLVRNYLFTFATDIQLGSNFSLQPSCIVQSDIVQTQAAASLLSTLNQKFNIGASYRGFSKNTQDALAIIGGVKLNNTLDIFYSYDISLSSLRSHNTGSHELLLRYNLSKEIGRAIPQKIIYSPRHF